jgi:hypothetical protein
MNLMMRSPSFKIPPVRSAQEQVLLDCRERRALEVLECNERKRLDHAEQYSLQNSPCGRRASAEL